MTAPALSTTIKSTKVQWSNDDIGMPVKTDPSGPQITQPCYIASWISSTATLSSACGAAGITQFTVGEPSFTAPTSTDTVLNLATELPLDPGLVPPVPGVVVGSHDCSEDEAEGFGIEGTWRNPGSFAPSDGLALNPQPAGTKAIGQILFTTSVLTFAAYVIESRPLADPLIAVQHYNIEFPGAPMLMALCASTATSPGVGFSLGVNALGVSQSALPTGVGRPGTSQLRATRPTTSGSATTIFITDDLGGLGVNWLAGTDTNFNRVCVVPSGKPDINFICGDG